MLNACLRRRAAAPLLIAALGSLSASLAAAQEPKVIRIIVPFGPGTPLDVAARDIAQEMRAVLNQNIIVDNKPGAAGMIGGAELARTADPATTFMVTTHNTIVINPHLYKKMIYDPVKDFAPIGLVGSAGYVLVARLDAPFRTLDQYLAAARARPAQISYGSLGVGSGPHLCGEKLVAQTGVKLLHVPYTTGSITSVVGGQVDTSWEPYATAAPFFQSGKLLALGASTPYRPSIFPPDVPLLPQLLPGYECTSWIGMFASSRAGGAVVARMADALQQVVNLPAFQQRLRTNGFEPRPGTPADLRKQVDVDHKSWSKIVRDAAIALD
jgi:tripartite-type tricarboxylate transporter receptor subunit TctC